MDVVEVPKKQRTKKVNRKKMEMCSRSNVLRKIIDSLKNEQFQHMLYWNDKDKKEFVVKFVHMNNPEWKNADYLELFKELDKLSKNHKKYLQDEKYDHKCKVRCKANLRKLVESKAISFMGKTNKGKSIQLRKYKLNSTVANGKSRVSKYEKMTTKSNVINIYLNIPVGGTCLSHDDTSHVIYVKNPTLNYLSSSYCIKENDKCGFIGCYKSLDQKAQGFVDIQNNGVSLINCTENLNMESIENFLLSNSNDLVKEPPTGGINLSDAHYSLPSENNELQFSNNSFNAPEDDDFQYIGGESKNYTQLVPSSPLNFEIPSDVSQFCEDYSYDDSKLLQQDYDPFLFTRNSNSLNDSLPEENENLISNNEGSFSFENHDAV